MRDPKSQGRTVRLQTRYPTPKPEPAPAGKDTETGPRGAIDTQRLTQSRLLGSLISGSNSLFRSEHFPVQQLREIPFRARAFASFMGATEAKNARYHANFPVISLLNREAGVETGS